MAAFRRPTNLKDMLVHSTTTPPNINPGFSSCNSCRCKTCPNTAETVSFQSSTDGQTYRINQSLSCYSHNVIYLITCNQCNKQYVGQTSQTLRQRFTNHRFDIPRLTRITGLLIVQRSLKCGGDTERSEALKQSIFKMADSMLHV